MYNGNGNPFEHQYQGGNVWGWSSSQDFPPRESYQDFGVMARGNEGGFATFQFDQRYSTNTNHILWHARPGEYAVTSSLAPNPGTMWQSQGPVQPPQTYSQQRPSSSGDVFYTPQNNGNSLWGGTPSAPPAGIGYLSGGTTESGSSLSFNTRNAGRTPGFRSMDPPRYLASPEGTVPEGVEPVEEEEGEIQSSAYREGARKSLIPLPTNRPY